MKHLEQYIKDHRPAFEEEPAAGHYARFRAKAGAHRTGRRWYLALQIAAAACVAGFLSLGILLHRGAPDNQSALCDQAEDMRSCYLEKIDGAAAEIDRLTQHFEYHDRLTVSIEVNNILQSAREVDDLLPDTLPEEESREILSGYYQNTMESLQTIIQIITENE